MLNLTDAPFVLTRPLSAALVAAVGAATLAAAVEVMEAAVVVADTEVETDTAAAVVDTVAAVVDTAVDKAAGTTVAAEVAMEANREEATVVVVRSSQAAAVVEAAGKCRSEFALILFTLALFI